MSLLSAANIALGCLAIFKADPSIKGSYSTFQYAHSPSYAVATIVRDNTHEKNSKSSLICQIIEELRRKNLNVDSALRK